VFLAVLLAGLATLAWAVAASGEALTRRSVLAVAALGALAATSLGVGSLAVLASAGSDGALHDLGASGRRAVPVARGILIAVPIVAGFGLLLTSADAVFARVVGNVLSVPFDIADLAGRLSMVVIVAWAVGGLLAVAGDAAPFRLAAVDGALGEDLSRDLAAVAGSVGGRLRASTEALVVLVAVDVLFAAFVVLQLAYLFGGQVIVAATGVTYSDYAREGYFQLVAVVAGAGMLLAVAELAARRPEGRSRAFILAALTLLGLTAVILASAAVRLGLYQQIYGWTELRFYVAASIGWLAIGGAVAIAAPRPRPDGVAVPRARLRGRGGDAARRGGRATGACHPTEPRARARSQPPSRPAAIAASTPGTPRRLATTRSRSSSRRCQVWIRRAGQRCC